MSQQQIAALEPANQRVCFCQGRDRVHVELRRRVEWRGSFLPRLIWLGHDEFLSVQ